jgi:hypothetical protein
MFERDPDPEARDSFDQLIFTGLILKFLAWPAILLTCDPGLELEEPVW